MMNVTSLEEMRQAQAARAASGTAEPDKSEAKVADAKPAVQNAVDDKRRSDDDKMELIRELLVGDAPSRVAALEARQAEFETQMLHRLDLLSQRLDALSRDLVVDRKTAFDELARSLHELGNRVRGI